MPAKRGVRESKWQLASPETFDRGDAAAPPYLMMLWPAATSPPGRQKSPARRPSPNGGRDARPRCRSLCCLAPRRMGLEVRLRVVPKAEGAPAAPGPPSPLRRPACAPNPYRAPLPRPSAKGVVDYPKNCTGPPPDTAMLPLHKGTASLPFKFFGPTGNSRLHRLRRSPPDAAALGPMAIPPVPLRQNRRSRIGPGQGAKAFKPTALTKGSLTPPSVDRSWPNPGLLGDDKGFASTVEALT